MYGAENLSKMEEAECKLADGSAEKAQVLQKKPSFERLYSFPLHKPKRKDGQDRILGGSARVPSFGTHQSSISEMGSMDRACRVKVHIMALKCIKRRTVVIDSGDPYIKVKIENKKRRSSEIKTSLTKDGLVEVDQSFPFDVKDPKTATLSLHLFVKTLFGTKLSLGSCGSVPIASFLHDSLSGCDIGPKWYDLHFFNRNLPLSGKVLMHILVGVPEAEQTIKAFVGTWNVGNARPPKDLSSWLPNNGMYEIVAVGSQECDFVPRPPFVECGKEWMHALKQNLGDRYKLVHATSRNQMRLAIFVRDDAEKGISEVDSGSEATGVGHVMANKGAVCIAFKFWDTALCFVNSHFAAHEGQCDARNGDYKEIVGQLQVGFQGMDVLSKFHHVFWMGDLNYRLDYKRSEDQAGTPRRKELWSEVANSIASRKYDDLLQHDELIRELSSSRVFCGFKEGAIMFSPTFKMQKEHVSLYDKKRIPAWCDRVLCRSLEGYDVEVLSYFSVPEVQTSDHKPVAATYSLKAYALPRPSLSGNDERWHICFTSLRATNLRASDMNGSSDPYISFIGPNLLEEFHTQVKHATLNPVWNPLKDLPTIVLNTTSLERLEREHLMCRVLDFDFASANDTLGYGVISLADAVATFRRSREEVSSFSISLLHHGLPAGNLEGTIQLTWEKEFIRRKSRFRADLVKRTMSFRKSLKKVIFTTQLH